MVRLCISTEINYLGMYQLLIFKTGPSLLFLLLLKERFGISSKFEIDIKPLHYLHTALKLHYLHYSRSG